MVEMESIQELIPFAKEMLSQKPSRGLLKVYLVGSLFAVLGTVVGLVETMCHPFLSSQPVDAEMLLMIAREQRTVEFETQCSLGDQREDEEEEEEEEKFARENGVKTESTSVSKSHRLSQRSLTNRLHAS
ncbi:G0/G1 switch protein 2-like [Acanthochromis polyacanthus]|uniref:G0/G1 switch protein 2-like n=1 Tax=Acanthochromis polyacanthus TaxID=80966 RepID=UPI000B8F2A79|nr:G0/G1 switch protein 2-like [Acanthochromis polyacanthus]XP_022076675.1 G0/G1 switch protein 2-like [Acanthochromis polyacanthus]XP_022076676.1 G0/G1 switch protein 2-like [Acanthochromis polyacanthus]XP_051804066.1 G0/G1 switch protein 2-like [Acanthochromis polyacanthus]